MDGRHGVADEQNKTEQRLLTAVTHVAYLGLLQHSNTSKYSRVVSGHRLQDLAWAGKSVTHTTETPERKYGKGKDSTYIAPQAAYWSCIGAVQHRQPRLQPKPALAVSDLQP